MCRSHFQRLQLHCSWPTFYSHRTIHSSSESLWLPELSPLQRIPSAYHLHLATSLPSLNWVIALFWSFPSPGLSNPSGFYLSKLRAATTVFCLLHMVILKCSKHSVSIKLLWIDIKYVYKISNPIILGSPGLDYEPLGDGCHFFSLTWSLGKGKADNKCLLD